MWFATPHRFDGLTFVHVEHGEGVLAAHCYPFGDGLSTFIVETDEATWREAGFDRFDPTTPPGPSDAHSQELLAEAFANELDGAPLVGNNSRWGRFRTIACNGWSSGNVALLGDTAHTAHFSVGSGTKMAMEDAAVLARELLDQPAGALERYETIRRPAVQRIQDAARPSLAWWERFGRFHDLLPAPQFAFHFLTRSITRARLARRDPAYVASVDDWWRTAAAGRPPLATPLHVRGADYPTRVLDPRGLPTTASPVTAPNSDSDWEAARAVANVAVDTGASLVAVSGGDHDGRVLVCEEVRLAGAAALLVDPNLDTDQATTLVQSGRVDLVASAVAQPDQAIPI